MKRTALVAVLALFAVLAVPSGPPASGLPQQAAGDITSLTITSAATPDYPSDTFPLTVCVNGQAYVLEVGGQAEIDGDPGAQSAEVFYNDDGACTGTPAAALDFTVAEGSLTGLVVGWDTLFTYVLDTSCMEAGTGRVQLNNGADFDQRADYYAFNEDDGSAVLLASDVLPGSSVLVPNVPAGPYAIRAYTPGTPNPETTAPIAQFGAFDLQDGYQTQVFLTSQYDGESTFNNFTFSQGPLTCAEEEPPTSTSTTTTTTTTTAPATSPSTATPAAPVSGAAAYTG